MPIATIMLSMSEEDKLPAFLSHWREIVNADLDVLWGGTRPGAVAQTAPYYPRSFFDKSDTKRAFPFTQKSLKTKGKTGAFNYYLAELRASLPANQGDLLWLVHKFLDWHLPSGGNIDLLASSESESSIYRKISEFCLQTKWKHHPHLITFKALVNAAEQGQDERQIGTNYLVYACQILRDGFAKTTKSFKFTLPTGQKKESSGPCLYVGGSTPKGVICEREAILVSDAVISEDEDSEIAESTGINATKVLDTVQSLDSSDLEFLRARRTLSIQSSDENEQDGRGRTATSTGKKVRLTGGKDNLRRLPTDDDDDAVRPFVAGPSAEVTSAMKVSTAPAASVASSSTAAHPSRPSRKRERNDNENGARSNKMARTLTVGGCKNK